MSDFVIKENELTGYVGPGGIVEIPGGVEEIGWGAFRNRADVTEVIIPEGVKTISADAFSGCRELKKVTIPRSVTHIGEDAFAATACYRDAANWKKNVLYLGDALIKARAGVSGTYGIEEGTRIIADHAFLRFISVQVIFCASQRRDFLVCNYSADVTSRSASTGTCYSFSRLSHTGRSSINSMLISISLTDLNSSDKLNLV